MIELKNLCNHTLYKNRHLVIRTTNINQISNFESLDDKKMLKEIIEAKFYKNVLFAKIYLHFV